MCKIQTLTRRESRNIDGVALCATVEANGGGHIHEHIVFRVLLKTDGVVGSVTGNQVPLKLSITHVDNSVVSNGTLQIPLRHMLQRSNLTLLTSSQDVHTDASTKTSKARLEQMLLVLVHVEQTRMHMCKVSLDCSWPYRVVWVNKYASSAQRPSTIPITWSGGAGTIPPTTTMTTSTGLHKAAQWKVWVGITANVRFGQPWDDANQIVRGWFEDWSMFCFKLPSSRL